MEKMEPTPDDDVTEITIPAITIRTEGVEVSTSGLELVKS